MIVGVGSDLCDIRRLAADEHAARRPAERPRDVVVAETVDSGRRPLARRLDRERHRGHDDTRPRLDRQGAGREVTVVRELPAQAGQALLGVVVRALDRDDDGVGLEDDAVVDELVNGERLGMSAESTWM